MQFGWEFQISVLGQIKINFQSDISIYSPDLHTVCGIRPGINFFNMQSDRKIQFSVSCQAKITFSDFGSQMNKVGSVIIILEALLQ